jgi:hypothetical protein
MMNEMDHALNMDGEKLRQLTGKDHGPFKLCEVIPIPPVDPRVQSLAILLAVGFAQQGEELDNLGDGESVVFMGKCPTINVVQLAEKINEYHNIDVAALKSRIESLESELENAHYEAMGEDL